MDTDPTSRDERPSPGRTGPPAPDRPRRSAHEAWSDADGAALATRLWHTAGFGEPADGVWAAPGRVNLIGEHVDYNGGPCLPIALPHRTFAAVRARTDGLVRLVSAQAPEQVWVGRLDELAPRGGRAGVVGGPRRVAGQVPTWVRYAAGPAWVLRDLGHPVPGFDAAVVSCVPVGAGVSSSAALECALALAVADLGGLRLGDTEGGRGELAAACVRAENEVVEAPTGGLDQAASLRARAGHALLIDTLDGCTSHLPLDLAAAGLALLVVDTRVSHALVDGGYAARRATCEQAAGQLGVAVLREVRDASAALVNLVDPLQRKRTRHVLTEIERVRVAVELIRADRFHELGRLWLDSHASLRDDYEVSCPELDLAVEVSCAAGALGARLTGGGFGGSAIALVDADAAVAVAERVRAAFARRGWALPAVFPVWASAGASRVD